MVDRTRGLRCGSALSAEDAGASVDCGSMNSTERFQSLVDIINNAGGHGADVAIGGGRSNHPHHVNGAYFVPTVVGNVEPNMAIAQSECM